MSIDVESDFSAMYIFLRRLVVFAPGGLRVKLDVVVELGDERHAAVFCNLVKATALFVHVVHRVGYEILLAGEENVGKDE